MKKKIILSSIATLALVASGQSLEKIKVIGKLNTKVVSNIHTNEVKNADLAEALNKKSPSINLIRRSGIANDILLRGQKRDNIKITIDDAVIHGACMNRMDPPTSHVLTSNIDSVEIKEGPFDVTEMGGLSGSVKVKTTKPTKKPSGEITATIGSYGYKKGVISASGGNEVAKILVTTSSEKSKQYKDGDGRNFYEQQALRASNNKLSNTYKNMDAYEKKSLMTKALININDTSELELSLTKNQSDNVLYPNTPMDADYDDSDIYNLKYTINNLNKYSKKLEVRAYHSTVDHPMSIQYRENNKGMVKGMTNHLTTEANGLKLLNTFGFMDSDITYGFDYSTRNWDGAYSKDTGFITKSLDNVYTTNKAFFIQYKNTINNIDLEIGARYDNSEITNGKSVVATDKDRRFNSLSANLFATYNVNDSFKYFFGLGRSYRIPDARELYVINKKGAISHGNDNLNQTSNSEIDIGVKKEFINGTIKLHTFYSKLDDYIYYNYGGVSTALFENIDATIYGAELNAEYYINDQFTLDLAMAYKKIL